MQKRSLFLLLLLVAILGIGAVVWFVLRPVLPSIPGLTTQQPPALPTEVPFNPQNSTPSLPTSTGQAADPNSPQEKERQAQEALKRQALDFTARQGTYSSADNFEGLRAITVAVTPELATKLNARLAQLRKDHPNYGPSWSQSMRPLSAAIDPASVPVLNGASAKLTIQAQQVTDSQGSQQTAQVTINVSFVKQGDNWIPSDVSLQ
jgi:hypothetical protein